MRLLNRPRSEATNSADAMPPPSAADAPAMPSKAPVPRTRVGAAWIGACVTALVMVVLIVFMLQNTRSVEVTFLWMHGDVPLAIALLMAGVAVAICAMAIGVARITQLRRLSRRR